MAPTLSQYDPTIIERAAARLYDKATAVLIGSILTGAVIGAAFGAVPLTSLGDAWPIPPAFGVATMAGGGLVGALVGYVIGDARAFGYRLQAQATLSQLALERNTAVTAAALEALAGRNGFRARPVAPAAPQSPADRRIEISAPSARSARPASPPALPASVAPPAPATRA